MADVGVNVKMGVSGVSQFKQGMAQAQASVKSIDAALKLNEKQFRATGDAETYMQNKTTQLNSKLQAQQTAVKTAEQALKAMKDSGVDPLSASYQKMETALLNARSAVLDTQNEINNLGTESSDAAGKTDQLASSLSGLNKKVSLDQVISAVGSITGGLEKAAGKAADLGKAIWENVMDSAKWADDSATMAMMYGVDLDTFLRVQKLVENGLDTSVEAILKSQSKLKKNVGEGSESFMQVMRELGLISLQGSKYQNFEFINPDSVALFWEAGQAIMNLGDEYEQEAKAQALFGKSWRELIPLFTTFKSQEEFSDALAKTNVNTEEEVNALAELNDKVAELKGNFSTLENKILAGLAPALTKASEVLSGLLDKLINYLETPEGKQALEDMGKAVEGLFSDLSNIDPEQVVEGFTDVFNKVVEGLQWLETNSGTVIGALEAIAIGWGGLKLTGGALDMLKLITGITGLTSGGTAAAAGSALGSVFTKAASIALAAAPWLAGLATLLIPAETGSNDIYDKNTGTLTSEGLSVLKNEMADWGAGVPVSGMFTQGIEKVAELFGDMARIAEDPDAFNAIARYRYGGTEEELIRELEALGYTRRPTEPSGTQEVIRVDENGGMYDSTGKRIGFQMPTREEPQTDVNFNYLFEDQIDEIEKELGENPIEIPSEPTVEDPEAARKEIEDAIGTIQLPVQLRASGANPDWFYGGSGGSGGIAGGGSWIAEPKANGIWSVPFDGYHAILHRGERVVPAREVGSSRNFSSNLYVESMYMNGGTDANGLAAAMAAAQRRTMNGYGS